MSTERRSRGRRVSQLFAAGATIAAGALLLTDALLMLLQGISAVLDNTLFVVEAEYIYKLNTTTWGWIHIVLAILMGIVAFGLFYGAVWARVVAIMMASLSIVAMFLWLPHFPLWSVVVIALDVIVIWAVTTWDSSDSRAR